MNNAQTVQALYEAFGRGDLAFILDRLHPDVEWERWDEGNSLQEAGYPLMQHRKGRDAVKGFFAAIPETIELPVFDIRAVLAEGDLVASRIRARIVFKDTGREIDDDEWWRRPPSPPPRRCP